jgi:hypothetical protein
MIKKGAGAVQLPLAVQVFEEDKAEAEGMDRATG